MIVAGTAGSGKSYLINVIRYAISQTLSLGRSIEEVVPVLAYTGCAAHNVNGATLHGTLKLGFNALADSDDMTPAQVTDLQDRCQHMRVMIIDAYKRQRIYGPRSSPRQPAFTSPLAYIHRQPNT
ncbi:hypothetical protein BGX38DRAFT_1215593 [Terfezia claveryi]|nr:hypothetical protein BGX38DRAFT_1215593 [Terfezia claveryi]